MQGVSFRSIVGFLAFPPRNDIVSTSIHNPVSAVSTLSTGKKLRLCNTNRHEDRLLALQETSPSPCPWTARVVLSTLYVDVCASEPVQYAM